MYLCIYIPIYIHKKRSRQEICNFVQRNHRNFLFLFLTQPKDQIGKNFKVCWLNYEKLPITRTLPQSIYCNT